MSSGLRVLGIEPAANVASVAQEAGIDTRVGYFTAELASDLRAPVYRTTRDPRKQRPRACARHPRFGRRDQASCSHDDGVAIIETPYLMDLDRPGLFETIYHEHVFYYSLGALQRLFADHDMAILDCEHLDVHGGSLR